MSKADIPGRGRDLHSALEALQAPPLRDAEETRKVQVVGRVVDGRIELDQTSLTEFTKNFPDANITFLAVNAPFDPVRAPAAARA